ncbi:hypothetical protein TWF730_002899 [Orbilia blumenaviensis]|uniref:Peptidase A1 domain-containing protein n=1 Tax=Orbilia blumenaviensis TaxID=1796055 RepID=A0AAV9U7G7_9PEZI
MMHRRKFFSTIVSSGLLLIPFARGQFPGKNTVDGGEGSGFDLATAVQDFSSPTETTPASGTCNSPVQLVGLSSDGPYIPINIDGEGPYNLAISYEEEETYIFSTKFCREVFQAADPERCFAIGSSGGIVSDIDGDKNIINPGEGEGEIKVKYATLFREVRIGAESENVVFQNYPTRVIESFEAEGSGQEYLESIFGSGEIHGIIGLKNSGDFIRTLSSTCKGSGWGINMRPGSFFSFGGIDVQASSIGTNDTSNVVKLTSIYTGEIRPITTNLPSSPNNTFKKHVKLDSMAPFNVVPSDIRGAVLGGLAASSSVDIEIAGVTFNIPWASLVNLKTKTPFRDDTLVLGAPFFEHIYAAVLPSQRQNIFFAMDTGPGTKNFKPFSEITNLDSTKTQPESSPSGSSTSQPSGPTSPNSRVDSSNDNEPNGSPAMVKSNSNNIGAIVGGVVGGVAVLILIIVGACCFYRRRKLMKGSPRGVEKEYEADFDAEIGHHDGFFPQFKESGYATLPTPPPPPGQTRPQIPSLMLESPTNLQYDSQTEYTPSLHPYHDDSPSRSLNVTPLPPPAQTPILTIPSAPERRLSITPSLSIEPSSPLSRNVSAASRQNFPSITQLQRNRSNVRAVPEEEDDYDVVSMVSGPTYHNPILASQEAASSAPRLPFMHRSSENDRGMGMTDRGAGL